ncbi:GNAT family N-acetyltransferase [Brevibacillus halotolerans]|uniref:GNAT family N-acetyltransferase n=1 Tax=Brevibacillus halotolerans TaxID=1507437 RepID=UPI001BB3B4D7|nr:GNAT family N-acetyltransferase [Brevibacillus halotolerans]
MVYWERQASNWLEAGIAIYNYDYWNSGYGTTFFKAWIDHLFKSLPLVRVGFTTWSGNQRISYVDKRIPAIINTIYSEKIPIEKSKSIQES